MPTFKKLLNTFTLPATLGHFDLTVENTPSHKPNEFS